VLLAAVAVLVARWDRGDSSELTLYGNIDVRVVDVAFNESDRIIAMHVEEGDAVEAGQLLAELDGSRLEHAMLETEAEVAAQRAVVARFEHGSRPEEIERARAEVERSRADAEYAKMDWKRLESLLDSAVISQQEVDNARTRYDMAAAALQVAEKNYQLAQLGPRKEQIAQGRARVAQAQASLEYRRVLLDATEVRAPINGTVLQRIAEVGEMITTSFAGSQGAKSAVVALADLDDLQVELDISQTDFQKISRQHECRMSPEAYADRVYECEIAEIAPEADRQKATIQVKVQILQPDEYLRPDMDARVTFLRPQQGPTEEQQR
jgi:multidrug resistance efflux pump